MSTAAIQETPATSTGVKKDTPTKSAPAAKRDIRPPKPLPAPNSDFYELAETLPAEELAVVKQVRAFMETKVAPIITKYWVEDAFPVELLPAIKELAIGGVGLKGYGCRGGSSLLAGLVAMEMARVDASIATFFGVHSGLAMSSIYLGGSEEQKQKWLPPMARFEKIGSFGLTEPLTGSGASGGLTTTAKREGDTWIINGQKKWIGNSPWCDIAIIWARDLADNQVKGFIVEIKTTPGFKVEKIQNKISLKVVQNGLITMENCRVPEENRLQVDTSFRDTAKVLKGTRYFVGWEATGCAMGAYENALKYCQERLQFGKPIGSFQLVQDLLAKMLANITASQCMIVRTAQLQAEGKLNDAHAALAKAFTTATELSLENVSYAKKGAIAYVTLNRPKVLNALSKRTWEDLRAAFENARDDAAVRGVILTGAGDKAFIAGADISELTQLTAVEAEKSSSYGQEVLNLIENLGKPVIAAINGFALGGGCETAMACTVRVAVESAKFGQPEVKLGVLPGGGGTQRLPRLVGKGRALQLILTGEMISAQEAYRIGLVNEVVPSADLITRAEAMLNQIFANAPVAVKYSLEAVNKGLEASQAEGLALEASLFGLCAGTDDKKEGTQAFLEKRKPQFQGK